MEKKKVTLVIPMYYEEKVAQECYKRVKENLNKLEKYEHEIIFVIFYFVKNIFKELPS